jgi:hypothetical protein
LHFFRPERAPELDRNRRNRESLSDRDRFRIANVKEPRKSESQGTLPKPPICPEEDLLPRAREEFRPQLEKMFDFMNTSPELRATLAVSGKDVVHIHIFCPKKLKPQIVMLIRVKISPNPLDHQGSIEQP